MAMIAGCIVYMTEYESWFALKGYKVEAQSQILERRLWEIFPQRCLTFWPYLIKDSKGIKEFLERDMPVIVETHMNSFGRFTTNIQWLSAWVKVDWRGKIWCISRDGRMWLFENGQPSDEGIHKLIWKIPEQGNVGDEVTIQAPLSGVFKSPLYTDTIAAFIDEFQSFKWFEAANEIAWERRAGMDLFIVRITEGTQKFELFLQPGKYRGQDIGTAVEKLLSRLIQEGGNHTIDATYEGKIMLRGL